MNPAQENILTMIDSGLIIINDAEQLKVFASSCFSASLPKKNIKKEKVDDYLKSFLMERSKLAAVNKAKTDGGNSVFTSRVIDYLVSRKYFTDFSKELKKHPKSLANIVLSELELEGVLDFSENKKRVSIR